MPAYKSTFEFYEDGEATTTRDVFVIADTYAGLSALDDAIEVDNDVFHWENTKHDLDGASGEFIEDEIEFSIHETRAQTANDFNAIAFAKQAQDRSVKRFIARIINPGDPLAESDFDFRGRVIPDMGGEDLTWRARGEYSDAFDPLRTWNCTGSSFDAGYLIDKDLFGDETTPGLFDLIDDAWKQANIKDRLGYFEQTGAEINSFGRSRLACWGNLVPLGTLLNKLLSLASSDGVTMTYQTNVSHLRGAPARFRAWKQSYVVGLDVWTRYVNWVNELGNFWPYEIIDDLEPLTPDNYVINLGGDGTADGDLFVSSRMFYPSEEEAAFSWTRYTTLRELLFTLASDFGTFPRFSYVSSSSIVVDFVPRGSLINSLLYIRDGTQAAIELRAQAREGEKEKYVGVATPWTREGGHVAYRYDGAGFNVMRPDYVHPKKGAQTAVTISPQFCYLSGRGIDIAPVGEKRGYALIPHGMVMCSRDSEGEIIRDPLNAPEFVENNRAVLHSGLYMRVPAHGDDLSIGIGVSDHVVAPVGRISAVIDGVEKTFDSISAYKNTVYDRDEFFYENEYSITVPGLNCFRDTPTGANSWKHARVAASMSIDGVDFAIVGIQRNRTSTELRAQARTRFDFATATAIGEIERVGTPTPDTVTTEVGIKNNIINAEVGTVAVTAFQAVTYESTGKVIPARPIESHIGKVAGIVLESGAAGATVKLQTSGRIDLSTIITDGVPDLVYVRHPTAGVNLSKSLLTARDTNETTVMQAGTVDASGVLTINITKPVILS